MLVLSGTGHRPPKITYQGRNAYHPATYQRLKKLAVAALKHYKPDVVISGMALGWDMALAEAALELGIPLICAIPFIGQEKTWPQASQDLYHDILAQCSGIVTTCPPGYAAWKMQVRNVYLADEADMMLALWDGTAGGTANCLAYAQKIGVRIENVWDKWSPVRA